MKAKIQELWAKRDLNSGTGKAAGSMYAIDLGEGQKKSNLDTIKIAI
jgi:hypothetical protein